MTSTPDSTSAGRFGIRWESDRTENPDNLSPDNTPELLNNWRDLAAALVTTYPEFEPMQHFSALVERKVTNFLDGTLEPDESLMAFANQIEDILYALDLEIKTNPPSNQKSPQ